MATSIFPTFGSKTTLIDLPTELQLACLTHLDYPSVIALSSTNHYFQCTIEINKLFSDTDKRNFVRESEDFEKHSGNVAFGCFSCCRVKPQSAFSQDQITGKYNKGDRLSQSRFCLDCGINEQIYKPGDTIWTTDRVLLRKCKECLVVKKGFNCVRCRACYKCLGLSTDFDHATCPRCIGRLALKVTIRSPMNSLASYTITGGFRRR